MTRDDAAPNGSPESSSAPSLAPVRLTEPERALLEAHERKLDEATRAHSLVCTTVLAARGYRMGFDVRIVERNGAELTLEPITHPESSK